MTRRVARNGPDSGAFMQFKDYYAVLGVARDASEDEIKRAFRKLARKHHPDVSKAADAAARMQELNEAYDVLRIGGARGRDRVEG